MGRKKEKKTLEASVKSFITAIIVIFIMMLLTYALTFIIPGGGIPFWKWALSPILVLFGKPMDEKALEGIGSDNVKKIAYSSGSRLWKLAITFKDGIMSVLPGVLLILMANSIRYTLMEGNILDVILTSALLVFGLAVSLEAVERRKAENDEK